MNQAKNEINITKKTTGIQVSTQSCRRDRDLYFEFDFDDDYDDDDDDDEFVF